MDEFDNAGRYSTAPVYKADGSGEQWMVWDGSYMPPVVVKDYRKKNRVNWKGTREEAEHLCALLNTNVRKLGNVSVVTDATELSKSQRIMYANKAARKRNHSPSGSGLKPISPFYACEVCKRMVKEGHSCAT